MSNEMINFLSTLISYPSISSNPNNSQDSKNLANFIIDSYTNLGFKMELIDNLIEGKNPLIFGKFGDDPNKKTIMFYSHYDVQPASIQDGWDTEPFDLIEKSDGYVYARGASDDKGPITATYFAMKELLETTNDIPVNIAILYEGEEESSSHGFEKTVYKNKSYFSDIDGILILDTSWFTDHRPSLDYGLRGLTYMAINVSGPNKDQHSGLVGGTIREPMSDLISILSKLIDSDGNVQVDGFYDDVLPLSDAENELYDEIDFNINDYVSYLGRNSLFQQNSKTTLMNMWRNPSLSIHGIQGAFSGSGSKTVVPASVTGKVSMRLVPNQDPKTISEIFIAYVNKIVKNMNTPNSISVEPIGLGEWWYGDVNNFLFDSAKSAIENYWGKEPNYVRSGGSIPIIPFMEKTFNAPAIGLPVGQSSDGAHSQNERLRIENLVGAKHVIINLLNEISNLN